MMNFRKKEGSITLFVLLALLFFTIILIGIFVSINNHRLIQNAEENKVKDIYEKETENIDNVYLEILETGGNISLKELYPQVTNWIPIYTRAHLEKIASNTKVNIEQENNKEYTFSNNTSTGYILKNDIDLSGGNWASINSFSGVFYGNNKEINNMTINTTAGYKGFFSVNYGTIRNIKFKNIKLNIGPSSGGIVGENYGVIIECGVTGSINCNSTEAHSYVGGITGYSSGNNAKITKSYNSASIKAKGFTGGISGLNSSSEISECFNTGEINGRKFNRRNFRI